MSHFYLNIYDKFGKQLPESEWKWSRKEVFMGDEFILVKSVLGTGQARRIEYLENENETLTKQLEEQESHVTFLNDTTDEFRIKLKESKKQLEKVNEKLKYVDSMGMTFGIMKTSKVPEGFLQHDYREGSTLHRINKEWQSYFLDNIELKKQLEEANKTIEINLKNEQT